MRVRGEVAWRDAQSSRPPTLLSVAERVRHMARLTRLGTGGRSMLLGKVLHRVLA